VRLNPPLERGILRRRYKRFLADLETEDGGFLTVHCPNTGAMLGCDEPGSEVWYSRSGNARRKYPHTLEVVVTRRGRAGVNTARSNTLVREALESGRLCAFRDWTLVRSEVPIPDERGRFDFLLDREGESCYVEVKNVTLCGDAGLGLFPDAVSDRAVRHLRALERRVQAGDSAALVFCVQHTGIRSVSAADQIHPAYGQTLREARDAGVEVRAYACRIERTEIRLTEALPVRLESA
jgi:sugar fermentation stimulation protein A